MNDAIILAENLTRRYGDFVAVDSINLSVQRGEIFGLLGTNGAGKTSTLEVLEGLAPASSGTVRVFGLDPIKDRAAIRPFQAVMLQEGGFPSDLTVRETLVMWAGTLSNPLPVDEVLATVGLDHKAGVRVSAISGGERRRLDLACAVVGQPSLLFLDEPTTGLDPESRRLAWRLLTDLNKAGTTIVLTTHYLEEAEALCDRLAIMHGGQIVKHGSLSDVIAGHASTIRFAALDAELPIAGASSIGEFTTIETMNLQEDLTTLMTWAQRNSIAIIGLDVREASLESVFLDIAEEPIA